MQQFNDNNANKNCVNNEIKKYIKKVQEKSIKESRFNINNKLLLLNSTIQKNNH